MTTHTQPIKNINYIQEVELYVTKVINEESSEKVVFHDIEHVHRVISGVKRIGSAEGLVYEEMEIVLIAAWFSRIGFKNYKNLEKSKTSVDYMLKCYLSAKAKAESFLKQIDYPNSKMKQVLELLGNLKPNVKPDTKLGSVLADATTIEWASKKAKKRIQLQYQEFLLQDVIKTGRSGYFDSVLSALRKHVYFTDYGREVLRPKKMELIKKLEKEQKDLDKNQDFLLSKELGISEQEVKKLKKNLRKTSNRDDRGIQTIFRTTSRNHYTLNQMVDRKANILISVNAIILSLIVGRIIGTIEKLCIHSSPIVILLLSSMISVTFAVLSILPSRTHGEFSEEEVGDKKGNLLYFGNFHNMSLKDYNWGMIQMLNDSNYLYSSMIRDLYYFGKQLHQKHLKIRIALVVFIIGISLTVVSFLFMASLPNFHLGGAHIDG